MATRSRLARGCAPGDGVLERLHVDAGVALLDSTGLLAHLDPSDAARIAASIAGAIAATDMGRHALLVARVGARVAPPALARLGPISSRSEDDRSLLREFILHCADLSSPLRPPEVSARVAAGLHAERLAQAARERSLGLAPAARPPASATAAERAASEVCFIGALVRPCFALLAEVEPRLRRLLPRVDANAAAWARLAAP